MPKKSKKDETQKETWSKNFAKNLLITIALFLIYLAITIFLIPLILPTSA